MTEPQKLPISGNSRTAFWQAMGLAWELGYLIVIPLVLFSLAGLWLDRRFDTKPWLLLGGMAFAITATTILLIRKFSSIIKDMNDSSETPKDTHAPYHNGKDNTL